MKLDELAKQHLPDGFEDEEQRRRQRSAFIEASTKAQRRTVPWWLMVGIGAGVAAAAALVVVLTAPATKSLRSMDGELYSESSWIDAAQGDQELREGSHTIVVRAGARLRVHRLREHQVHLDVGEGVVDLEIDPNRDSSWKISAGPYDVLVVGTVLAVDWSPNTRSLRVPVYEGEVRVVENGARTREFKVLSGEYLIADDEGVRVERKREVERVEVAPKAKLDPPPKAFAPKKSRRKNQSSAENPWQKLALNGEFAKAMGAVENEGYESVLRRVDTESLVLLGDVARLTDHPEKAQAAYSRVVASKGNLRLVQAARFRLARLLVDRGKHREAAALFAEYLNSRGPQPLEEEANGRWLDSLSKSGQTDAAKRAAKRYLKRKLDGPWRSKAEEVATP